MLRPASILHQVDGGQRVAQAVESVDVVPKAVRAVARRHEEEGRESALNTVRKQRIVAVA